MCNILTTAHHGEKRMKILAVLGTAYVGYFSCHSLFEFSLGSLGALCKMPDVNISKSYFSHSFHPISTKLYGKYGNQEEHRLLVFGNLPNLKKLWHFDFILNTGPYGTGNFKTLLLHFSPHLSQTF